MDKISRTSEQDLQSKLTSDSCSPGVSSCFGESPRTQCLVFHKPDSRGNSPAEVLRFSAENCMFYGFCLDGRYIRAISSQAIVMQEVVPSRFGLAWAQTVD